MNHFLLDRLKTKRVYSVEGNIGAGKSTLIKRIGKSLEDVEFVEEPVAIWENLGGESLLKKFYEEPLRYSYSFQSFVMYTKAEAVIKAAETEKPIIMVERSLLTDNIFNEISNSLGKLEPMEYQMLNHSFEFLSKCVYPQLAGIIYLKTPLDECVNRIKKRSRNGEQEVDRNYLAILDEKFDKFINTTDIPTLNLSGFYDLETAREQLINFIHPKTD